MRYILLLVLWGISSLVHGQIHSVNYTPLSYTGLEADELKAIKDQFIERTTSLNLSRKKEFKLAKEYSESMYSSLKYANDRAELSTDDSLCNYLQTIVDRLVKANHLKENYYRVFLHLSDVPNASNYGEGIIVFNIGLLSQLPSEAHIAFVLGHEIAHDEHDHVFQGIENKVLVIESDAFKRRIKEIEDQEYNQRASIIQLRKEMLSGFNEHGRAHELVADSLSVILLKTAGYEVDAASETILMLDTVDYLPATAVDFQKFYSFAASPFQEKWLQKESSILLGSNLEAYVLPDSLKTHPSCEIRDSMVQLLIQKSSKPGTPKGSLNSVSNRELNYYEMAQFEHLEYLKNHGQFAELQYRAMSLAQQYPDNIYLKNTIGFSMYGIYSALYSHLFSQAVPMSQRETQEDYGAFLDFLHRLNLSSLKKQFIAYTQERLPQENTNEYTDLLQTLAKLIQEEDEEERQDIISTYSAKHGETNHYTYLTKQFPKPESRKKRK